MTLIIDVQTIPHPDRRGLHSASSNPPAEVISPAELIGESATAIKTYLKGYGLFLSQETVEVETDAGSEITPYLELLRQLESRDKPRSTVLEAIAEAEEAVEKQNLGLALTPETLKIVCASYWSPKFRDGEIMSAIDTPDHELYRPEREILGGLSLLISKFYPVVVWNAEFTMYAYLMRCAIEDVKQYRLLDMRSWGGELLDLKKLRFPHRGLGHRSLFKMAEALNIPNPIADIISGADIAAYYQTDPDAVIAYSQARVLLTREIYHRWARLNIFVPYNQEVPGLDEKLLQMESDVIFSRLPQELQESIKRQQEKTEQEVF